MNRINLKNNLSRIWKDIKIGVMLPALPNSASKFHNNTLVRIFIVLGGISILLRLSKSE